MLKHCNVHACEVDRRGLLEDPIHPNPELQSSHSTLQIDAGPQMATPTPIFVMHRLSSPSPALPVLCLVAVKGRRGVGLARVAHLFHLRWAEQWPPPEPSTSILAHLALSLCSPCPVPCPPAPPRPGRHARLQGSARGVPRGLSMVCNICRPKKEQLFPEAYSRIHPTGERTRLRKIKKTGIFPVNQREAGIKILLHTKIRFFHKSNTSHLHIVLRTQHSHHLNLYRCHFTLKRKPETLTCMSRPLLSATLPAHVHAAHANSLEGLGTERGMGST